MSKLELGKPIQGQRVKYIDVEPQLILDLLKVPPEGKRIDDQLIVMDGDYIPEDAEVSMWCHGDFANVRLVVKSEEFPVLGEGAKMMRMDVVYIQTQIRVEPKGMLDVCYV